MMAVLPILALPLGLDASAQEIPPAQTPAVPATADASPVETKNAGSTSTSTADATTAVVNFYNPSTIAPTATTSGTSETSRPFAARLTYAQVISQTVNPNAFLPSDDITDNPVILLPSTRLNGWWDVSAAMTSAFVYDSNITRSPAEGQVIGDFYEHDSAAVNFRLGTAATPVAFQFTYDFDADTFDRLSSFDTYTHNLNFQGRIGRSNVIFNPYFIGSFRSVSDPAGLATGRESYDYLQEGLRGENIISPGLIHTYDFSHTSVVYNQRVGEDFQIWHLYQEMDVKPFDRKAPTLYPDSIDNVTFFPWLDLQQTSPTDLEAVNEVSGGVGGSFQLDHKLSFQTKVGYGAVQSDNPSVSNGSFSGIRYNTALEYSPLRELRLKLSYNRVLSFSPATVGRSADVLDFAVAFPLAIGSHFVITPAIEVYYSVSNDYQVPAESFFPEPSLQFTYQMNDHMAFFGKIQYRDTDQDQFDVEDHVRVLQTSAGITATF